MNKILEDYYKARAVHDSAKEELDKATYRIIKVMAGVFKIKDFWWSYKYYGDGDDDAPLPQETDGADFFIYVSKDMDSGSYYYNECFPVAFFDMTDEAIKEYIKHEINENERREELEKERKNQAKKAKELKLQAIKESAAQKLTKEERKALNL